MPAPLIAKVDRLAPGVGDPPPHFFDVVAGLPGLEAAFFLRSADGSQRAGVWLWRGREGMRDAHAALAEGMGRHTRPEMIEERVFDVVTTHGETDAATARTALLVHLGPLTTAEKRAAYLANVPRAEAGVRTIAGLRASVVLADPAGRDLVAVSLWETAPDRERIGAAIAAQPVPAGLDTTLLAEPSHVEAYDVVRTVRPAVTA